jgi:hypothetical protein
VLARAHQSLIWARQRHVNALRSALREFYPGALAALGAQLAEPEALAVLELAPTPEQGRRLTRAAIRRALVQAGRRRNLQTRVVAVHDALAAPQLAAPAPIEAAYREVVAALVAMLGCLNDQVAALEQQLAARFAAHPDAAILRSQPGLGMVLGARVLAEFGDDPARYQTAKGRKAFAGTARSPGPRGYASWWWPERPATSGWWMPATCGRLRPCPPRRAPGAAMTPTEPVAPPTIRRCGPWATGWSASCTAAWPTGWPTRNRSPGPPPDPGVPGGCTPRRYWPVRSPGGQWCRWAAMPRGQGAGRKKLAPCRVAAEGGSRANLFRRSALTVATASRRPRYRQAIVLSADRIRGIPEASTTAAQSRRPR